MARKNGDARTSYPRMYPLHSRSTMTSPGALRALVLLGLALLVCAAGALTGCATGTSAASAPNDDARAIHPIEDLVEATKNPAPIGKFLADLNGALQAWNNLTLTASTDEERRRSRLLETHLRTVTHERRAELIEQLETGPLNNRIVAAMALGFAADPEVLSPLIAALDDAHEEVISHALLGLWLQGKRDTPLEKICALMQSGASEQVRGNAALCLRTLLQAGAKSDCAVRAARVSIVDPAPSVRTQCALILANEHDVESIQAISDRLYDAQPIVVSAAARALEHLGGQDPHVKGPAARALVKAWIAAKDPAKNFLLRTMIGLSGSNFGSDEDEWAKWAQRLP